MGPAEVTARSAQPILPAPRGRIYALIAVGLTLIFGVMRVVNFAHGEFLMLGMYLAFWAFALLHLDPYVTLVVSLPLIFGFGWLSYRMVMRPVIHASHNVQIDRKSTRLNSSHT